MLTGGFGHQTRHATPRPTEQLIHGVIRRVHAGNGDDQITIIPSRLNHGQFQAQAIPGRTPLLSHLRNKAQPARMPLEGVKIVEFVVHRWVCSGNERSDYCTVPEICASGFGIGMGGGAPGIISKPCGPGGIPGGIGIP